MVKEWIDKITEVYTTEGLSSVIQSLNNSLEFKLICELFEIPEDILEKYASSFGWYRISKYQVLSEKFIETHKYEVNWLEIVKRQKMSVPFIENHIQYIIPYFDEMMQNPFISEMSISYIREKYNIQPDKSY